MAIKKPGTHCIGLNEYFKYQLVILVVISRDTGYTVAGVAILVNKRLVIDAIRRYIIFLSV